MHYLSSILKIFKLKSSDPKAINKLLGENFTLLIVFLDFSIISDEILCISNNLKVLLSDPEVINLLYYEISTV